MTLRRRLIHALDRPGGRAVLGAMVTHLARRVAPGVRVYFNRGMWMHRSGDWAFVGSPILDYHPSVFGAWAEEPRIWIHYTQNHWMHVYESRPGDVVMDIGAGKGEDAIAFSQAVGSTGRVYAIEAHPITFRCLQLFQELNRLENVVPMHYAITGKAGPVAIYSTGQWQSNSIATRSGEGSVTVPGMPLDELIEREKIRRVDFLKMNIEGAEAKALEGMQRSLGITQALCISCHDFRANQGDGEQFRTKALVKAAVKAAGFRTISRDEDPLPYLADQVNAVRD